MLQLPAALNLGTEYTISIVCRLDPALEFEILGCYKAYSTPDSSHGLYLRSTSTHDIYHAPDFSTSYFHISPTALITNAKCSFRLVRDNRSFSLYQNNVLIGTDTMTDNPDFIIDNLFGESAYWGFVGGLYEIMIYDKVLSTSETSTLTSYLNSTYNV